MLRFVLKAVNFDKETGKMPFSNLVENTIPETSSGQYQYSRSVLVKLSCLVWLQYFTLNYRWWNLPKWWVGLQTCVPSLEDPNGSSDVLIPKLNGASWRDVRVIGCLHGDGTCEALSWATALQFHVVPAQNCGLCQPKIKRSHLQCLWDCWHILD